MNAKTSKSAAVALFFMTGVSGCSLSGLLNSDITSIAGKPADTTSINEAVSRRDEVYLEEVCKGESRARQESDKEYACSQLERLRGPQKALAASCDNVVKAYEDSSKDEFPYVQSMADKMVECGHYTYLFEHVVHWGNKSEGAKILGELEDKGKPVEAEFVKYLASHKGPQFFATKDGRKNDVVYGLGHITKWLVQKGHTQHCAAFADAAKGASVVASVSSMEYFKEAKCKEGIPVAMDILLGDEPGDRAYACRILGVIGDASVLSKVKVVADTDGYSTVKEEERNGRVWATKVYPVRDACLEASGKISLRK